MASEVAIVVVLAALGFLAYRDVTALYRWDPLFFQRGLVVIRRRWQLPRAPAALPEPRFQRSFFGWQAHVRRLGPREVTFTAQTMNGPLLKGQLLLEPDTAAVVLTGRLVWGILPLFVAAAALVAFYDLRPGVAFLVGLAALVGAQYWSERRRFIEAAAAVVLGLAKATTSEPPRAAG